MLIVAKKNVKTLDSWEMQSQVCVKNTCINVPLLIIDDEFDEASVQKNEDAPSERITQIWGEQALELHM